MLDIAYDRWTHDTRIEPDGSVTKILRANFRIGPHRFTETVPAGPGDVEEIQRRAAELRNRLPGAFA